VQAVQCGAATMANMATVAIESLYVSESKGLPKVRIQPLPRRQDCPRNEPMKGAKRFPSMGCAHDGRERQGAALDRRLVLSARVTKVFRCRDCALAAFRGPDALLRASYDGRCRRKYFTFEKWTDRIDAVVTRAPGRVQGRFALPPSRA